jgi:hypothetical protein
MRKTKYVYDEILKSGDRPFRRPRHKWKVGIEIDICEVYDEGGRPPWSSG